MRIFSKQKSKRQNLSILFWVCVTSVIEYNALQMHRIAVGICGVPLMATLKYI